MKYTKLDTDQQRAMLEQRIQQYEAEHYNHQINYDLLEASGLSDDETERAKEMAKSAMKTLDQAHAEASKKLASLKNKK